MRKVTMVFVALLLIVSPVAAETIYIWTDENGVKRFSNQLPEGVEDYETEQGAASDGEGGERPEFDRMIEEVKQENRQSDIEREEEAARRKAEAERKAKEEKEARIAAERARLQEQIDALNNRALSPTFTQGMRDHRIRQIQERIDALK